MLKAIKLMSILLAANAEAVVLIFLAWWIGKFLNQKALVDGLNWLPICFVIAIVCIAYSWWIFIRILMKDMQNDAAKKADQK